MLKEIIIQLKKTSYQVARSATYSKAKIQKLISVVKTNWFNRINIEWYWHLREILNVNSKRRLTSKDLADTFIFKCYSNVEVISDCKDWLNMFDIKLNVIHIGIELEYSETSYRLALKNYITKLDEISFNL